MSTDKDTTHHLRELMERATPGEWRDLPCPEWARGQHMIRRDDKPWGCFGELAQAGPEDASLIVAMRNALPALLAVVEAGSSSVAPSSVDAYQPDPPPRKGTP